MRRELTVGRWTSDPNADEKQKTLDTHAIRPDVLPFCGRDPGTWTDPRTGATYVMQLEVWQGYADQITCKHHACQAA